MKAQSQESAARSGEQAKQSQGMKTHEWQVEVCSLEERAPGQVFSRCRIEQGPAVVLCACCEE